MTNTEATPAHYEQIWSNGWDDMRRYGPMARHSRRIMLNITRDLKPAAILDVGCGEGSLLKALLDAHPNARGVGVEIADNALALARRAIPTAGFAVLDIARAGLNQTFDLVVCADVVEHISDDEAALRNMAAMTNPGGYVVVATLQGRMRKFEEGVGHVRNYAHGELEKKIIGAGLIPEHVVEWGFPLYSPFYRDLLELLGARGTMGRYGPLRKLLCHVIYTAFLVNSWQRGDYIFLRARKPG